MINNFTFCLYDPVFFHVELFFHNKQFSQSHSVRNVAAHMNVNTFQPIAFHDNDDFTFQVMMIWSIKNFNPIRLCVYDTQLSQTG